MKKRLIFLIVAVLISTNCFAAVVSDNDGAAFVTKAEFEAMKTSFNEQIDKYNSSIDNRIDGAIASYLAGINIDKKEEIPMPLQRWNTITMMNGFIKPKFYYPSVNISAFLMGGFAPGHLDDWVDFFWSYGNAKYTQSSSYASYRPTIKNVKEDGTDDSKMTWDGVKNSWVDKISANYNQGSTANLYAYEIAGIDNRFFVYQMACFNGPGYVANLDNSISNIWKVNYGYYSNYSGYGYHSFTDGTDIRNKNIVFEVFTGNTSYEHICNWNNTFAHWEVYNEKFLNTFKLSNYDTLKANDWFTLMTKDGTWYGEKFANGTTSSRPLAHFKNLSISNTTYSQSATNYFIPRIGLYSLDVEPIKIYQTQDSYTQVVDKDEKELPKLNLVDGFVMFYAKDGDEIEWDPEFKNLSSSESGLIDDTTEVCLVISTSPFNDGTSTEGSGEADLISVKNFDSSTETKYPTSVNRKMKLKWTMPKDSFVYAKWYPVFTNADYKNTKDWQIDLDLVNSGTYRRLKYD